MTDPFVQAIVAALGTYFLAIIFALLIAQSGVENEKDQRREKDEDW